MAPNEIEIVSIYIFVHILFFFYLCNDKIRIIKIVIIIMITNVVQYNNNSINVAQYNIIVLYNYYYQII